MARIFYRVGDRQVTVELDEHQELGSRCVVLRGVALRVDVPGDAVADVEIVPISVSGRRLHEAPVPVAASA